MKWNNTADPDGKLKELAVARHQTYRPEMLPALVFLLGELHETSFRKVSSGGMFASKKYFDVQAESAAELAEALKDRTWE